MLASLDNVGSSYVAGWKLSRAGAFQDGYTDNSLIFYAGGLL
jgi:hypothetical protein